MNMIVKTSKDAIIRASKLALPRMEPGYRKYTAFMWGSFAFQSTYALLLLFKRIPVEAWQEVVITVQCAFIYGFFGASAIGKFGKKGSPPDLVTGEESEVVEAPDAKCPHCGKSLLVQGPQI